MKLIYNILPIIFVILFIVFMIMLRIELNGMHDIDNSLSKIDTYQNNEIDKISEKIEFNSGLTNENFKTIEKKLNESSSKIFNLDITICNSYIEKNVITKRHVIMKNIVATNPNINGVATVINLNSYGDTLLIPTVYDTIEDYACDLKIISVK